MNEDEKFFAWLDGELEPAEAAAMEAKVAADPKLSRLAEQHRALGAQLRGAFDPLLDAPVPDRLKVEPPQVASIAHARAKREARRWAAPQWAAMAATLVAGIVVGTMVPQGDSAPIESAGGKLYAAADLDGALDRQLASAPAGDVRIGVTFRTTGGEICRSFTDTASSGLACRDGDRWQLRGLFGAPEGQAGEYRMAAGMDPNLAALLDSTMAGEPLDAAAEKAARDRGWR